MMIILHVVSDFVREKETQEKKLLLAIVEDDIVDINLIIKFFYFATLKVCLNFRQMQSMSDVICNCESAILMT